MTYGDIMTELSKLIRSRRLALRLTQREAAERASVSLATWQNLERPASNPEAFQDLTLACAAHGLGLELGAVFTAAQRPVPIEGAFPARGGSSTAGSQTIATAEIASLVLHLEQLLMQLAEHSAESAMFVYGQAVDAATHLIDVHAQQR